MVAVKKRSQQRHTMQHNGKYFPCVYAHSSPQIMSRFGIPAHNILVCKLSLLPTQFRCPLYCC